MKIKTINIYPSVWKLDIIVGGSTKELKNISEKRYGLKDDPISHNQCNSIDSSITSELKGKKRVVLVFKSIKNKGIVVHELIHALWHLSSYIGYEIVYESGEWQAVLAEYIFNEITNTKGYIEYNNNN